MYTKRLVTKDTYYVGGSDRRLALFENIYPLTNGVSYNSYLIMDKETCLMDTVDMSILDTFLQKIKDVLDGRDLDYLVINHMEPDHSATVDNILKLYKNVKIVTNFKVLTMLKNYFEDIDESRIKVIKEGDKLELGEHILTFIDAPMVHWPEVMMTYDTTTKTLFSADAFGTFGALSGNLFAHEMNFDHDYLDEARRYYCNIVGKYGTQVQAVLKKAGTIEIDTIAPLHGPIWRQDLSYLINLYDKWSSYEAETKGVLIVYGSIYGHTEKVANMIADELSLEGIRDIHMYDASKTDKSYLVAEAFKYSHLVICSSTYNMGIFTPMEEFLLDLKYHNLSNRTVAIFQNGSWAPNSDKLIREIFLSMKNIKIINEPFTIKSNIKEAQIPELNKICAEIAKDFPKLETKSNALFNIQYGLYVLTTKDGDKDNGCIVNTVSQVCTDKVLVAVNKANYTADLFMKNKIANVSILTTHTPFSVFKNFGYQSGKTVDKFATFKYKARSKNGLFYISKFTNGYLSLKCVQVFDLGSHYGFLCEVTENKQISFEESLTYSYYMNNIKPKPAREVAQKKGWICKICGYFYEGENLPKDFICPICKHPASDFIKVGF
ncbi:MAG: flavin reductase [Bacilli bacterium]